MRWAKVPEWLLPALLAAPRDKRIDASPHVALACFVTIAGTHADWRTMKARVKNADLADELAVNTRTVRRALVMLERVGAASVVNVTERGGQTENEIALHVDAPGVGRARPPLTQESDPADARVIPLHRETAGQVGEGRTHASPLYSESASSPEAIEEDVWGLIEAPTLPLVERDPDVVRWLNDPDRLRHPLPAEAPPVRAMRAASRAPEPDPRVPDLGRTCSEIARRLTDDARTASGEGGGR